MLPRTGARGSVYAIELDNLTKDYGSFRALHGVSAQIPKGAVGLLGPNGAGKSTLVKTLLGLVAPTSGRGVVLGIDIADRPLALRQRVGYMPEVDCHVPGLTAAEFTSYAGELCGMPPHEARKRAHEVLDYVGIDEERYRSMDGYSTGMRQKAKLAQALVHDPELLLLDEPTNGLDPQGRDQILELCRDLARNHGKGLIYSSHLLADVEFVCDQVVILQSGAVVTQGTLEELRRKDEGIWEVRIQGEQVDAFFEQLTGAGLTTEPLAPGRYRLVDPAAQTEAAPAAEPDTQPEAEPDPETEAEPPEETAAEPSARGRVARLVFQAAKDHAVRVRSLRPSRSTLEDVFMDALEVVEPVEGGA